MKRYEELEHTADIAIRAYGASLAELFENAAFAMFDHIADLDGIKPSVTLEIALEGASREELLVKWLDELLYHFYTKWIIFCEFRVSEIDGARLTASVSGRHVGANRNRLKAEIKAATYSDLLVKEEGGRYSAEIIFDV